VPKISKNIFLPEEEEEEEEQEQEQEQELSLPVLLLWRNAKIWGLYGRISLRTLSHIPIYPKRKEERP
jgi:hypothetical protein